MEGNIESRIGQYLSGEMPEHEKTGFEQQMNADPLLRDQYLSLKRLWDLVPEESGVEWDTASAWDRLSGGMASTPMVQKSSRRKILYLAVAATFLIGVGVFAVFFSGSPSETYTYQEGIADPIILKDGSKIFLNENARVKVLSFTRKQRQVELTGEAFFEITPDPLRPFFIMAGQTLIEVVGTSFNVNHSPDRITIYVSSGKIIFSSRENTSEAVALAKGEAAVFESNKIKRIPNPSPNLNAWRTHQLQFKNMPLSEVVADISSYFGQDIVIEQESIKSCGIYILRPFEKPEIGSVLRAIALSINAKLIQEGERYIIRGGSCS